MPDTPTEAPASQRAIQFVPKMQGQKKEKILAVAWITAQHDGYEGNNVSSAIARDLTAEGFKITSEEVRAETAWLEAHGYAVRSQYGRRVRIFMLEPDVVVPKPGFVRAHEARERGRLNGAAHAGAAVRRPPTPMQAAGRPTWLPELVDAIERWHDVEPEEASRWARQVMKEIA